METDEELARRVISACSFNDDCKDLTLSHGGAIQVAKELARRLLAACEATERYRRMAEHYFVTPEKTNTDPHQEICVKCTRNLRDPVHKRSLGSV